LLGISAITGAAPAFRFYQLVEYRWAATEPFRLFFACSLIIEWLHPGETLDYLIVFIVNNLAVVYALPLLLLPVLFLAPLLLTLVLPHLVVRIITETI